MRTKTSKLSRFSSRRKGGTEQRERRVRDGAHMRDGGREEETRGRFFRSGSFTVQSSGNEVIGSFVTAVVAFAVAVGLDRRQVEEREGEEKENWFHSLAIWNGRK